MAKRKNPLQDIDKFLSQEATNLVTPNELPESDAAPSTPAPATSQAPSPMEIEDMQKAVLQWAEKQGDDFRSPFYDMMLKTLEGLSANTSKDKMLINTLLYLQNPDSWKTVIKDYWS